jgi:carbamoyl-phosphate synthase large subunit
VTSSSKLTVLIAGVGGASLGTELLKCLVAAGRYRPVGCDISPTAYGLSDPSFVATRVINRDNYVDEVLQLCADEGIDWIVPGGESPMVLLADAAPRLKQIGVGLVGNSAEVVRTCSDKSLTFSRLAEFGFRIPATRALDSDGDVSAVATPCIVKPSTGSGGSASVFFAADRADVALYAEHIRRMGARPIAQEYLDLNEGEFTIGVLSLPGGRIVGSVALRRNLDNKLSISARYRGGVISSGYSQGYIGDFPELRRQAEEIATAIGSEGPINVQGRVRGGVLVPFEINPRLSASTYLRAIAGFNEIDLYLRAVAGRESVEAPPVLEGWYLRSFTERFVAPEQMKA